MIAKWMTLGSVGWFCNLAIWVFTMNQIISTDKFVCPISPEWLKHLERPTLCDCFTWFYGGGQLTCRRIITISSTILVDDVIQTTIHRGRVAQPSYLLPAPLLRCWARDTYHRTCGISTKPSVAMIESQCGNALQNLRLHPAAVKYVTQHVCGNIACWRFHPTHYSILQKCRVAPLHYFAKDC